MSIFNHSISIVEQENWGNEVYALDRYYFAIGARYFARTDSDLDVLSGLFSARCFLDCHYDQWCNCRLKAGFYVSLMRVLTRCRDSWLCLSQLDYQSGFQAALMRLVIQAISHLSIYHQVSSYHAGLGQTAVQVLG